MITIYAPHPNKPFPKLARALLILKPIQVLPFWEKIAIGRPIRQVAYTDLRGFKKLLLWHSHKVLENANPRSANQLLEYALEFFKQNSPATKLDLAISTELKEEINSEVIKKFSNCFTIWSETKLPAQVSEFDGIILLYADSIGLGWSSMESHLYFKKDIIVFNGRRRVFALNANIRTKLAWHRFLERSRIMEFLYALGYTLLSIPLAVYDRVFRSGAGQ